MKRSSAILFTLLGFVGQAQAASTGTINFSGIVTSTTCDVLVNGQAADATVMLPTVSDKQLSVASSTTGRTSFELKLQDCQGALKTANAFFEAGPNVDINGHLLNQGTAQNVVLQLRDGASAGNSVIVAGSSEQLINSTYHDISSGAATLPYQVEYYATGAATAGSVISNVVYSVNYK